jgi:hypothetical protein
MSEYLNYFPSDQTIYLILTYTYLLANLLTQGSPDLVFLAGGLPNPNTFPFQSASIKLRDGSNIQLEGKTINDALQYGPTQGYNPRIFLKCNCMVI